MPYGMGESKKKDAVWRQKEARIILFKFNAVAERRQCAPLPELMDRKKRDIMERKGDKEDENKRQKQQKESSAAAL